MRIAMLRSVPRAKERTAADSRDDVATLKERIGEREELR